MTITIGTRVRFEVGTTYRPYLHSITGVVVELKPWGNTTLALVRRDDGLMDRLVDVRALEVVEAAQDDVADALAASDRPFEMLTDDYAFMRWCGDLGGAEW